MNHDETSSERLDFDHIRDIWYRTSIKMQSLRIMLFQNNLKKSTLSLEIPASYNNECFAIFGFEAMYNVN